MPYDGQIKDFITAPVEPLSDDRAVAVRQAIALLRGPLPENFHWNFEFIKTETACGTAGCALGWFMHAWPKKFYHYNIWENALTAFDMLFEDATYIFSYESAFRRSLKPNEVTPAMVANDMEAWADQKYGRPADAG